VHFHHSLLRRDVYSSRMTRLSVPVSLGACLNWDYATSQPRIQRLYDEARQLQWDELRDIDWSLAASADAPAHADGYGPAALAASALGRYGSEFWPRFRREQQAWMVSQFLHGEQSALVVSARLAEVLPDLAAKGYAASQAAEEARHVAAFARYVRARVPEVYEVSPSFERLLEQMLGDARWDVLVLGMQVMIEALALGAFRLAASTFDDPLLRRITELVARDEARHVSFGVLLLEDVNRQLGADELRAREDFVITAAELLGERYLMTPVWERLEVPLSEGTEFARSNVMTRAYRATIFARVVHTLKRVHLFTPRVQAGFERLGLLAAGTR
jgi:hypothetical protein